MLTGALALALTPLAAMSVPALAEGERLPKPQPGDKLAFMTGDKQGQEIKPSDLVIGAAPTMAYPLDPATGKVLESRVNLLTIVRLKPEDIGPGSQKNAADGIVAFSALCTHYGCPVTSLDPSENKIVCNCHGSVFDAGNKGAVFKGPAVRRLAMMPLAITDGALLIAGKFDGPLGPPM
jgi:Rieske Fe-S protein